MRKIKPYCLQQTKRNFGPFAATIKMFLILVLLGSFFNSNAQKTIAQQLVAAAGPASCPGSTDCNTGVITVDGNPCDWGTTNQANFATRSYVRDAFGNGVLDSQFTEGSKDFFEAEDLRWAYGQTKAKNDIANGAAVLIGTKLYFAGDRTSNNGDAQIGFWFYLNGTGPTTQTDGTQNFAPNHAVGDLLVLADFTGGGNTATVTVYEWVGTGGDVANTNGTLHTTGCTGIVAENNATSYPVPDGWLFIDPCYATNEFYEGVIDLSCISSGNPNPSFCFSSFLLETRSSQSITASLDDFIAGGFNAKPAPPTVPPAARCGSGSVTLTATCTGSTVRWYTAASGGNPIVTGGIFTVSGSSLTINPLTTTTTFYASCFNVTLNCESDRTAVIATINPAPAAPTLGKVEPTCTVATGCVTVTSSTTGLTFSLDGGAFAAYPAGGWCGLAAGSTHCVRAQSAALCISPETCTTLAAQPPTPAAPTLGKVEPTCTVATGCVTVTSSTTGLTFSLDGGAFAAYPAGGWCGLTASSTHCVRARNASLCISPETCTTLAAQPPTPVVSCTTTPATIDLTSAAHSTQLDAVLTANADQNPAHYTYVWTEDGSGSLSSLAIKNPVYTAALGDAGGTVHFTITVTNTVTGCVSNTSNCSVNVSTVGTCTVTGPSPICSGSTNTYASTILADELSRVWTVSAIPSGATDATISGPNNGASVDVIAGSTAYRVTVTITFLNQAITTSCWEDVTVNACGSNCTYTQGYYGNKNGNSCDADGTGSGPITYQSPIELMTALLSTDLTVGVGAVSITVPAGVAGATKLNSVMPGNKTPKELTNTSNCVITDPCFDTYVTGTRINNVLLSQTITLGLNLRITSTLSGFQIKAGVLATADPVGGCGSTTPKERSCCLDEFGHLVVTNEYTHTTILASVITALDCKTYAHTVAGLYALANDALADVDGTDGSECGASLSDINDAVDAINNAFDKCKIFIGWDVPACTSQSLCAPVVTQRGGSAIEESVTTNQLTVSAYPNPYTDKVRFEIKSPVSGQATLEVFNSLGQKMQTVFKGFIFAGRGESVDYNVPALQRTNLFYTLKVGGKQVTGKLINVSQ